MLLPVLLAHAPRIRMREATGALLRTRFAPSLLHVSVMNDPLSLERYDSGTVLCGIVLCTRLVIQIVRLCGVELQCGVIEVFCSVWVLICSV